MYLSASIDLSILFCSVLFCCSILFYSILFYLFICLSACLPVCLSIKRLVNMYYVVLNHDKMNFDRTSDRDSDMQY